MNSKIISSYSFTSKKVLIPREVFILISAERMRLAHIKSNMIIKFGGLALKDIVLVMCNEEHGHKHVLIMLDIGKVPNVCRVATHHVWSLHRVMTLKKQVLAGY